MNNPLKTSLAWFFSGAILLLASTVQAPAALAADVAHIATDKVSGALTQMAVTEGEVRVIVMLDTDAPTIDNQSNRNTDQLIANASTQPSAAGDISIDKRLAIKRAGRNVIQRMALAPGKVQTFSYVPMLRAEVGAAALQALAAAPEVKRVVEDRLHHPTLAQSVPLVEADATQALGFGGQGQAIAVLDTGVDASHPFLSPRVVEEACFSSNTGSTSSVCPNGQQTQIGPGAAAPCDAQGCSHGTHVAGIAAGSGTSFNGVAPEASIIGVQVFSRVDSTNDCLPNPAPCTAAFTSDIIAGLERVFALRTTYNIAAVNMSLGGGSSTTFCDGDPVKTAVDALRNAGIASVIASGNEGETNAISSPACISSAVSVGSTTKSDVVSSFSNSATFLTLLAPGGQINSSVAGGGFTFLSGTSMATPHVAGAFAAIRSASPQASVDDIVNALSATGLPVTDTRNQVVKPRIRVNQAIAGLGNGGGAALAVQPLDGVVASGEPGGPFAPNAITYTLTNNGSAALPFVVSTSESWLAITPASGSIPVGDSTQVTVELTAAATNLLPGAYSTSVLFDNTDGSSGDTIRTAALTVQGAGSANDKFSNAVLLTENSGSTLGSTAEAGIESGEPIHAGNNGGRSIWWQWVAPANGELTIDTFGSDFDTLLAVYTGASVSALSSVASNDDAGGRTSQVSFNVDVGTNYLIAVDGFDGVAGNVVLNWDYTDEGAATGSLAVTPVQGLFATGNLGGPFSPASRTYTLTNTSAGTIDFDVLTNGAFVDADTSNGSLAPGASTTVTVSINAAANALGPGTSTGSLIVNGISRTVAVTVDADGSLQDDFADRDPIVGSVPLTLLATNSETGKQIGEPDHASNTGGASVWWTWTAPVTGTAIIDTQNSNFDTLLAAYTGSSLNGLTEVASNDDGPGLQSLISFGALAGQTYAIAVDGFGGAMGSIALNLDVRSGRPSGDNFSDAQPIMVGLSLNDTLTATAESGEPAHGASGPQKSIWWRWQATGGEQVVINTLGSDFDTVLAVYTGSSLAALTPIAVNDDTFGLLSQVSFTATAGTVYHVAVDGFRGASGSVRLNVEGAGLVEQLVTSTLPTGRSVRVGDQATVFATLINTSPAMATNCSVSPDIGLPATFSYVQTDPITNQPLSATANQPFALDSGAAQTLLMSFVANQPVGPVEIPFIFSCDGIGIARVISGLNTVILSASNNVVADVVALAATTTNLGVVLAGENAPGAFSVATVNVGATEVITATPNASFSNPAIAMSICQTDPLTGACITTPAPSVTINIAAGETPTFGVFLSPSADVVFAPDENRVQVVFSDATGNVRGSTSVAVSAALP